MKPVRANLPNGLTDMWRVTVRGLCQGPARIGLAAKHAQPVDTSMSHVGFRCVVRQADAAQ